MTPLSAWVTWGSPMVESYVIDSIDRSEVLRYMGYAGQSMSPELERRIDTGMERCLSIGVPRGVWRIFDVDGDGTKENGMPFVRLAGTSLELLGTSMQKHMDGAVAVGVMAVTVGMGVERELRRLSLTDRVGQIVFDAAATTLVERTADACEASIVAAGHERGLFANFRFSPGYGDMPMTTQPVLLQALDAQRQLGITLTDTMLMVPTKSVTAVVGLFETIQPSTHATCAGCPCFDFCIIRPTGHTCRG